MLFAVGLSTTPPSRALGWMLGRVITGTYRFSKIAIRGFVAVITTAFRYLELTWISRIGRSQLMSELRLSIPPDQKISAVSAEQFLSSLPRSFGLVGYEIIGTPQETIVQFACRPRHSSGLRSLLEAYFPNCTVTEGISLTSTWQSTENTARSIVEHGLSSEFVLPVHTFTGFDVDPLIPVFSALEHLRNDEAGVFQVLFRQPRQRRIGRLLRAQLKQEDASHSPSSRLSSAHSQKISRPIYAACVRIAARAPSEERATQITTLLGGALQQFADPARNAFTPRYNFGYTVSTRERDLIERGASRGGILLNSLELAGLVHLPSSSVRSPKLTRQAQRTKAAPGIVT